MSYFDDLIDAPLIQRELSVRGKTVRRGGNRSLLGSAWNCCAGKW
jgi:hypothetical protein